MLRLKLLRDNVLVLPHVAKNVTKGGIVIPQFQMPSAQEGTVMTVGPGRRTSSGERIPVEVIVGEVVRYSPQSGVDIKLEGVDYKIIPEWNLDLVLG